MGMLVPATLLLCIASMGTSAQSRDSSGERQVMLYYAIPWGAHSRAGREPVFGLKLETSRSRSRAGSTLAATPPEVDLQFSLRSGIEALKLQGRNIYRFPGTLNQGAGEGQDSDLDLGVIVSLGLAIAGASFLIVKAKDKYYDCRYGSNYLRKRPWGDNGKC